MSPIKCCIFSRGFLNYINIQLICELSDVHGCTVGKYSVMTASEEPYDVETKNTTAWALITTLTSLDMSKF